MDSCDAMEKLSKTLKKYLFDKLVNLIIDHGIARTVAVSIAMCYLNMKDDESNCESDECL